VTPDDATPTLAESYARRLTAFDISANGSRSNRGVWADLDCGFPGGICLEVENAIRYAGVPSKRCLRLREGARAVFDLG